jgi:hypothetical protein
MKAQRDALLNMRRLPLVFDLDDTLVRLVGNPKDGYVPESHIPEGEETCLCDAEERVWLMRVFSVISQTPNEKVERRQVGGAGHQCR